VPRDRGSDALVSARPTCGTDVSSEAGRLNLNCVPVVVAVLRRLGPQLVAATLIPSALCYLGLWTFGLRWGVLAAAIWACLAAAQRIATGRPVPGLLIVAIVGLWIKCGLYLMNGNELVYFLQPIVRTLGTALLFACSVMVGKPLVARFAGDFCSFDATDVGERPAIVALFRRLTYLWAAAQVAIAGVNLTLLLTVPVSVFIGTATGATWLIIGVSVVLTVADAVRTTRNDGLRTGMANGHLHAYVPQPSGSPTF
jgi:hypothetical protein